MDRRLFNLSSLFAATTLAGCGGGDSSQSTSEFTPETLEKFDASGPEIKRENLTDIQQKNYFPRHFAPLNAAYQVETTFLTTMRVSVKLQSTATYSTHTLAWKESTGGTNNALGFALLQTGETVTERVYVEFVKGGVVKTVTLNGYTPDPFVKYNLQDGEGNPCIEWAIHDPFMSVSSTSVAVYIRIYEIPLAERTDLDYSGNRLIINNAKHQNGAGLTGIRLDMRANSKVLPGYHALNIRSITGDNHDTVMLPSSTANHYNHYVLVPTLMGASVELKPYLARRMARHGLNLGKASAAVHGPLDHPTNDESQFNMLINDKMRMVWGTGGTIHLMNVQNQFSQTLQNNPPNYTVSSSVTDYISKFIGSFNTDALRQALIDSLGDSMKSGYADYAGAAISAGASFQCGASWQSDKPVFIGPIPVVPGGGGRFSIPIARVGAGFGGYQGGRNLYYFLQDGKMKFTVTFIVKLWNSAALKVAGNTFDIELTLAFTHDWGGGGTRFDSFTIEPVIDWDQKTWIGWILDNLVKGALWLGGLARRQLSNSIVPALEGLPVSTNAVSDLALATSAPPALPGGVGALPSFGTSFNPAEIIQQAAKSFVSKYGNTWKVGEFSLKLSVVNSSMASGTFQKGWTSAAPGLELSWKDLYGVGFKGSAPVAGGTLGGFVRIMTAYEAHVAIGTPTYLAATQYQTTV